MENSPTMTVSHTVKLAKMCKQAKLGTKWHGHIYNKFSILGPLDRNHALQIGKDNNNHLWELSILGIEMDQIDEYEIFHNMGRGVKPPRDHECIWAHFIFDVKDDLRRKSRLIAGGHMTEPQKTVFILTL
jgi:hypothetical protein